MKFDKENLIKHKFWIVCGTFLILWLVAFTVLLVNGAEPARLHRDEYEKAKAAAENALKQGPKNDTFLKPWDEHKVKFLQHKDIIWEKAWLMQKDMYTWPQSEYRFEERMTSPWAESANMNLQEREDYKNILYQQQIDNLHLDSRLAPVELVGGVKGMIQPVEWANIPTLEEMWIAQEDLCVRRELLLEVIAKVNKTMARMAPVKLPASETLPTGVLKHVRCRNDYWELDLFIEQGKEQRDKIISARSTIKNIHASRRMLPLATLNSPDGIVFRITQGRNPDVIFSVTGEPLPYGHSTTIRKDVNLLPIDYKLPFDIDQVFDWYTAPVKRVEAIHLGLQSARTVSFPLKARQLPDESDAPAAPAGRGGQSQDASVTPKNQLPRDRYLQVTPECRHLPLGLLLDVDQSAIPNVLEVVGNSRLRIQVTQVQISHAVGMTPANKAKLAQNATRGGAVPGRGGAERVSGSPPPGAPTGPPGAARTGTPSTASPAVAAASIRYDDPNVVHLGLYGIAALYERYEPKK